MSDVIESLVVLFITKNPFAVSLIGSVILSVVGFVWVAVPFARWNPNVSYEKLVVVGYLAFIVVVSGVTAFFGFEVWPGIIMLGGITRAVLGQHNLVFKAVPSITRIRQHINAYKDLITGYYDEREISKKHENGELGYWGGGFTYLVYSEREMWWWIRGLDLVSRPCTVLAVVNGIFIQPFIGSLIGGRPLGQSISISIGTAFIANFWIVGGSLLIFRELSAEGIDKARRPNKEQMQQARYRLERYYGGRSLLVAVLAILMLIVVGSYGTAVLLVMPF